MEAFRSAEAQCAIVIKAPRFATKGSRYCIVGSSPRISRNDQGHWQSLDAQLNLR